MGRRTTSNALGASMKSTAPDIRLFSASLRNPGWCERLAPCSGPGASRNAWCGGCLLYTSDAADDM
eukprot:12297320-Alexandrium_andersonii.AAC.1